MGLSRLTRRSSQERRATCHCEDVVELQVQYNDGGGGGRRQLLVFLQFVGGRCSLGQDGGERERL